MRLLEREWTQRGPSEPETNDQEKPQSRGHHRLGPKVIGSWWNISKTMAFGGHKFLPTGVSLSNKMVERVPDNI